MSCCNITAFCVCCVAITLLYSIYNSLLWRLVVTLAGAGPDVCVSPLSQLLQKEGGVRASQETKEDIPNKQTRIQPDEGGEHIHIVEVLTFM